MWTDLFWRDDILWIARANKTLTPLYPFITKGHYNDLKDITKNFNNIQNKFTSKFIDKYKNTSFSGFLVVGAYWVDIQDEERTIYFIDNVKDKDITVRNIFTNETGTIEAHDFLDCHMPLGLEFKFFNYSLRYYFPYSDDNINIFMDTHVDINKFLDTESDIAISVENINGITINKNPVPLTEPSNHYMNENAVITTKVFDSSIFECGKAYTLRYSDGKNYTETYEALLVNVFAKKLIFNYYDTKSNKLQSITLEVGQLREDESGEGWDIWKMMG